VPSVKLKGLNQVRKRLSDGRVVVYWYAWKGGPRLEGKPGSAAFVASYMRALETRKAPSTDTLSALIVRYKGSPEFRKLADSTRAERVRWLDRITAADISRLPTEALNDTRARAELLEWRDGYADRPRTADYAMQVLSAVLSWSVKRGYLASNILAGASQLYRSNRADEIWTPDDLTAFAQHASPEVSQALRLACLTGLRRSDLIALTWGEVGDTAIVHATEKSGGRVVVTVPLIDETRALLAEIGRRADDLPVLRNTRGQQWTADGLENRIIKAKAAAGIDKHLHDARGTFATRLRLAGLTASEIGGVMGWTGARVERILARYVDRDRVVRDLADRLQRNKTG
jgi:integrase